MAFEEVLVLVILANCDDYYPPKHGRQTDKTVNRHLSATIGVQKDRNFKIIINS